MYSDLCSILGMPFYFLLLPPEVRNQIYGCVFDKKLEMGLIYCCPGFDYYPEDLPLYRACESMITKQRGSNNAEPSVYTALRKPKPSSYYTAMLQTSWQIYRETCYFLYAKAIFRYTFLPSVQIPSLAKRTFSIFPKGSVQYVKDLAIELDRGIRLPFYLEVEAIAGFVDEACALERLSVIFEIYDSDTDGPDAAWAQSLFHNEGVWKALTTSKSLRYVRITVRHRVHHDGAAFAALSQSVAGAKGWVCEAQNYNSVTKETGFGHFVSIWSWHLRPASKTLMQGALS